MKRFSRWVRRTAIALALFALTIASCGLGVSAATAQDAKPNAVSPMTCLNDPELDGDTIVSEHHSGSLDVYLYCGEEGWYGVRHIDESHKITYDNQGEFGACFYRVMNFGHQFDTGDSNKDGYTLTVGNVHAYVVWRKVTGSVSTVYTNPPRTNNWSGCVA